MGSQINLNFLPVLSRCSAFYKNFLIGKQFVAILWSNVKSKCIPILLRFPGISDENLHNFFHKLAHLQRKFGQVFNSHLITISSIDFQRLRLYSNGTVYPITQLLSESEMQQMLVNLYDNVSTKELQQLHLITERSKSICIINQTLPSSPPIHEPRTLMKRSYFDQRIFMKNNDDIFVISGIGMQELTHMTIPDMVAYSGDQLNEITAKIILLENIGHWCQILAHSTHPVHLLEFDPDEKIFILRKTQGTSNLLRTSLGSNYETTFEISEEMLITEMQKCDKEPTKVCICDSPGMGKSFVLVSLARLAIQQQEDLVMYIKVSDLLEELYQSYMRNIDCKQAVEYLIYKYATPAGLARKLLQALFKVKTNLSVSLFLDGLDEVSREDQEWTKHVLRVITASFPNVKLFLTARPYMRPDLEKSLGFTTFGIFPLSHQLQVNLMVNHLKDKVQKSQVVPSDQLQNWVDIGIKTFRQNLTPDVFSISGIPLQCHLISKVILNSARQQNYNVLELDPYQITNIVGDSLFGLYKKHVELHYHLHKVSFSKNLGRKSSRIPGNFNFNRDRSIQKCYQVLALQTLFPSFIRANSNDFSEEITRTSEIFHKAKRDSLNEFFTHQTVAEYLVAEFIANSLRLAKNTLAASHCTDALAKLLEFLFCTVLATPQESYSSEDGKNLTVSEIRSQDLSFNNLSIVYFLHGHLFTKMIHPEVYSESVELIVSKIGTKAVFKILQSSLRHDFINIYYFAANLLLSLPQDYPMYMSKNELNILVRVACMYSSLELLKKLTKFMENNYSLTLQDICDFGLDNKMLSLVQYTCFHALFDKLKYLVDMNCQIQNRKLLYICARNSAYDSSEILERRVNIISLLTTKNKCLIQERDSQGNSPLFAKNTSIDIIKMLIDKGADVLAIAPNGKTMAHHATSWMSASVFHQLVVLLLSQGHCAKVFAIKDLHGKTPLDYALTNVKFLQSDTVNMIYNAMERLSNQEDLGASCNDIQSANIPLLPLVLANMPKTKPGQQWRPFCEEYSKITGSDNETLRNFGTNIIHARDFTDGKGFCVTSVHNEFWGDQNVIVKTTKLEPGNYSLCVGSNNIKTILDCCRHENIARYYSINLCKEKMEIVTVKEYYRLSLEQWIKNESGLKIGNDDKEILQQTTNGLAFLHKNGIVHGNIKPENIFVVQLSPNEIRVKLSGIEISHTHFSDTQDVLFSTRRTSVEWTAPDAIKTRNITTGLTNLKLSKEGDIFSLGCLFYYILSNGTHPFGSSSDEIESNIKTNKIMIQPGKLKGPNVGCLHLIFSMIDENPKNRPPLEVIKKHHIFWPRKVSLNFLVAVSNAADQPLEGSLISKCLDQIEKHPLMVIYCEPEGSTGWMRFLSKDVQKYVQGHGCKRKPYCGDLIFDLLRAIRNMQTHYMTLPAVVKTGLGEIPSSYCDYWLQRFPVLLDLVWLKFQTLKHDTSCGLSDYYCSESDFNFSEYSEHENKLLGRCVRVRSARIILNGKN